MHNQTTPTAPEVAPVEEAPAMGFLSRLTGIYFEPGKTFEDINRKPTWLMMCVVLGVLTAATMFVLLSRMDYATLVRKQMESSPFASMTSEDSIAMAVSRPPSAFQRYSSYAGAPLIIIGYLIIAGLFMLLFNLMGASLSYKKSLAVCVWGMGPPEIIVSFLSILFIYIREPHELEVVPVYNVISNLGPLVPASDSRVVHGILSSIDAFSFWTIFLLAVGYAAISDRRLTTKKAATGLFILWGVYVLLKAGYHASLG